ncbi:MAG: tetraacyldisaccharide 4'-kinase [Pirellulaceae bacterium]
MTFDHRSVMSGQRSDPLAMLMRMGLRILSWPYGWEVRRRNRQFDSGRREVLPCGVPVISVGNLTTGGTGKTPIVCYLAKQLRQRGLRVAIVSRGYGRGEADENDEAIELHSRLPDVPHVQNPDRFEAARIAVEELEAEVILMDDGFQHRRLHRNKNIVVIDATCPFGFGYLLPRGLLREPIESTTRADLVLISRCDCVGETTLTEIESTLRNLHSSIPIIRSNHAAKSLLEFPDTLQPIDALRDRKVAVVCAIGNPTAFVQTIEQHGGIVIDTKVLPDHDRYTPDTMAEVREWVRGLGDSVNQVVCTHKDLVKLRTDRIGGNPLAAIMIDLQIVSDASQLDELLSEVVGECGDVGRQGSV